jgi:hypothetical protein
LWAQIRIQSESTIRGNYDFAGNYCAAQWLSNAEYLGCPVSLDNPNGGMTVTDSPRLESRNEDEPAIWMHVGEGRDGWISAEYPPFRVSNGDRFVAEIGCLRDNPQCVLAFDLDYRTDDGIVHNLDEWRETYDEDTTRIDLDLGDLDGETVQFILRVTNKGRHRDANAFWLAPRIESSSGRNDLVLSWRKEGGLDEDCFEVKVYLTGRRSGEANARSCVRGTGDSGSLDLTSSQVDQVTDWFDRFNSFEYKVETPVSGETLVESVKFHGDGKKEALDDDIRVMMDFMYSLYNSIIP